MTKITKNLFTFALFTIVAFACFTTTAYAATGTAWVYYLKYGANASEIWRVKSDGSTTTPEKVSTNFDPSKDYEDYIRAAGDYFFYLKEGGSLFRIPNKIPQKNQQSRIIVDNDNKIINYVLEGNTGYYLTEQGKIISFSVNATTTAELKASKKEFANMVDINNPAMFVLNGHLYFNTLKDGRTLTVSSKALTGATPINYVATGVIDYPSLAKVIDGSVYMMVDTNPAESEYSTPCMVLFKSPVAGGVGVAVNAKAPIDANAVYYGQWLDRYFLINDGLDEEGNGTAKLVSLNGAISTLHEKPVVEAVNSPVKNTYIFVDGSKTYSVKVVDGKVSDKIDLKINETYYARNLQTNDKIRRSMVFSNDGSFTLDATLKPTKLIGVEWDMCLYRDGIEGIFYINAGDEGKLYIAKEDGSGALKLTNDKVLQILAIIPVK